MTTLFRVENRHNPALFTMNLADSPSLIAQQNPLKTKHNHNAAGGGSKFAVNCSPGRHKENGHVLRCALTTPVQPRQQFPERPGRAHRVLYNLWRLSRSLSLLAGLMRYSKLCCLLTSPVSFVNWSLRVIRPLPRVVVPCTQ